MADNFNISGFFAKSEVDLPLFEIESDDKEDVENIEIDPEKIITEEYGFDFDMYIGGYHGEHSIASMKALLKISKSVNSVYGAIMIQNETVYYPEITSGLNKTGSLLAVKKKDPFFQDILQ